MPPDDERLMRCGCCDRILSETEVSFNTQCDQWEYCGTCLMEIKDVFGDGDVDSEEEIDEQLELEFADGILEIDPDSLPS